MRTECIITYKNGNPDMQVGEYDRSSDVPHVRLSVRTVAATSASWVSCQIETATSHCGMRAMASY